MLLHSRPSLFRPLKRRSVSSKSGIPIALIAKLRKASEVSISKAKEALSACSGDYEAALVYLRDKATELGAAKASKVSARTAAQGLIGLTVDPNGHKGSLIEVNCETDFVGRSKDFGALVERIGVTHLLFGLEDLQQLKEAPLLPVSRKTTPPETPEKTVEESLMAMIGKLGEKMEIRRGVLLSPKSSAAFHLHITNGYVHGLSDANLPSTVGRIGALVTLKVPFTLKFAQEHHNQLFDLAKKIAQHVVGFNPQSLEPKADAVPPDAALMTQEFLLGGGSVSNVLKTTSKKLDLTNLEISDFQRFECGEGIEKEETNFAEEVQRQAGILNSIKS